MTRIQQIAKIIIRSRVFEDRLKYTIEDLMLMYGLNKFDASDLRKLIHKGAK